MTGFDPEIFIKYCRIFSILWTISITMGNKGTSKIYQARNAPILTAGGRYVISGSFISIPLSIVSDFISRSIFQNIKRILVLFQCLLTSGHYHHIYGLHSIVFILMKHETQLLFCSFETSNWMSRNSSFSCIEINRSTKGLFNYDMTLMAFLQSCIHSSAIEIMIEIHIGILINKFIISFAYFKWNSSCFWKMETENDSSQ